jgi:hypothetical protein
MADCGNCKRGNHKACMGGSCSCLVRKHYPARARYHVRRYGTDQWRIRDRDHDVWAGTPYKTKQAADAKAAQLNALPRR